MTAEEPEPFADLEFLRVTGRNRPPMPRIAPVPIDELDEQQNALLDRAGMGRPNMLTTVVRHPRLFERWSPFGGRILRGVLPSRERELLILRTTWLCGCDMLWESHVRAGMKVGLSQVEAERVAQGPDAPGWNALDAAIIRAVDELAADACIADATWEVLDRSFDEHQLIEIPILVGCYFMNTFVTNSLGIQLDTKLFGHPAEKAHARGLKP